MHNNPYYIAEDALILVSQAQRRALEAIGVPNEESMPETSEASVEGSLCQIEYI